MRMSFPIPAKNIYLEFERILNHLFFHLGTGHGPKMKFDRPIKQN